MPDSEPSPVETSATAPGQALIGLCRLDAAGRITWADAGFAPCVGLPARAPSGLTGQMLRSLLAGADVGAPGQRELGAALAGDAGFAAIELSAVDAAGAMRHWRLGGTPRETDGARVVTLLDLEPLRRAERERAVLAERLEIVQRFGRIGVWERDPVTLAGRWDGHMFSLWQMPAQAEAPSYAQAVDKMVPGDRRQGAFVATLGQPGDHEARIRIRLADGSLRHVHSQWRVSHDDHGTPRPVIGIMRDDTEVYQLAQRLEAAAESARIGLWSGTLDDLAMQWSGRTFLLFGLDPAGALPSFGHWLRQCVHAQDRDRVARALLHWKSDPAAPFELELRVPLPLGGQRRVLLRGDVERPVAATRRVFGVAIDVTELHEANERLRSAAERSALAARSVGIGTWELEAEQPLAIWDEQMFRLRGLEPAAQAPTLEALMKTVHPEDREPLRRAMTARFERAQAANYEFRVVWPDGSVHWLASRSTPVLDAEGREQRRIGVNWDVTERKAAELAQHDKELALRESRAKSQFLARMSHELRTPLNAVLGFTQLLQAEAAGSGQADMQRKLTHIRSAGDHLLALINDALDLSSLESGELRLVLQPVGLTVLVNQALPMVAAQAARQGIALRVLGVHGAALADPTRLLQVLINLLSNAIKFSRPGGEVRLESRREGARLLLLVHDTGLGLSQAQRAHLFEPFNRLGAERLGIAGTGIGLTIVKALVQAMGGSIAVASEPGAGSCFTIDLPAAQLRSVVGAGAAGAEVGLAGATVAGSAVAAPLRPGRLLYIEDNPVNALLVEELVRRLPGITLCCAGNGAQGLAMALEQRPDLILVDMHLPDFDGDEVLRRLRRQPPTATIPCIALSANAMPEDISRAMAEGFADYWTKPIDAQAFVAALDAWFQA